MSTVTQSAGTVQRPHTLFADAVKQVSALAQDKLPESLHGRVQRATALVLNGAMWGEEDRHTCLVQSSKSGWYAVNCHCTCADASKALEVAVRIPHASCCYIKTSVLCLPCCLSSP